MKKSLITILIIVIILILGGVYYVTFQKGSVKKINNDSQTIAVSKVDGETVNVIDGYVKSIDLLKDLQVKVLPEDMIDNPGYDGGIEIKAFIKDGQIQKISESTGLSYGMVSKDYYFDEGKLIYVYEKEEYFPPTRQGDSLDYAKLELGFENKNYFIGNTLIKSIPTAEKRFTDKSVSENDLAQKLINKSQEYFGKFSKVKKPEVPTPLKTNTTTTYMCEGRVKIVRVQDSPSLPPRVSYLRASDNVQVASYGDFGAYIRPEYFSIDRAQIEQGYSFNEVNFCKYLKN